MKVRVQGLTPSTITFNSCDNVVLRGEVIAALDVVSPAQEEEIRGLISANLIKVLSSESTQIQPPSPKVPEGELATSVIGSDAEGKGIVRQGKFVHLACGEMPESPKTQASLKAMEKLKEEEDGIYEDDELPVFEEDLNVQDQMGREAIIGGPVEQRVKMNRSAVPGDDEAKETLNFIDPNPATEGTESDGADNEGDPDGSSEAFLDYSDGDDEFEENFIEI